MRTMLRQHERKLSVWETARNDNPGYFCCWQNQTADWSWWCHHPALCTIHLSVIIFLSEFLSQRPMIARFFCRAELVVSSQSPGLAWSVLCILCLCLAPPQLSCCRPVCLGQACAQCWRNCEYFKHTNISTYSHNCQCNTSIWIEKLSILSIWRIQPFMSKTVFVFSEITFVNIWQENKMGSLLWTDIQSALDRKIFSSPTIKVESFKANYNLFFGNNVNNIKYFDTLNIFCKFCLLLKFCRGKSGSKTTEFNKTKNHED